MKELPQEVTWEQMKRALRELGIDPDSHLLLELTVDMESVSVKEVRTDEDGRLLPVRGVSTVTTILPFNHRGDEQPAAGSGSAPA